MALKTELNLRVGFHIEFSRLFFEFFRLLIEFSRFYFYSIKFQKERRIDRKKESQPFRELIFPFREKYAPDGNRTHELGVERQERYLSATEAGFCILDMICCLGWLVYYLSV
uniref:Uncharacterized protein n=1 Tax=Cacopsylla melanoneura TaxID=428564 RepID=A0A8D8WYD3_9HEMI